MEHVEKREQTGQRLEGEPLLQRLCDLYVSYRRKYVLCLPTGVILTPHKKDKHYALLTNGVLRKHLAREYAVAIFAGTWGSKFICFDVDDGDAKTVRRLLDCLEAFGFPRERVYVSFSGGKGYHVEIFFDKLAATEQMLKVYHWVIDKGNFDPRKVEFRPTNNMAIKLPLSVHARTGKICWYVDRETLTPIEHMDYLMEVEPVSSDLLTRLIAENIIEDALREGQTVQDGNVQPAQSHCGGKATEETRNLGTTLMEDGTRHNMMRNIAVYSRCHGMTAEECRKELSAWYERQDKSLIKSTCEQVLADIDDLVAWVYSERFEVNYAQAKGEVILNETDIRLVLSQRSRCARRIVFLLLTRCKALQFKINYDDIAKAIHASRKTTIETIRRLERESILEIERGRRYSLGGGEFAAECNSYAVPHEQGGKHERQHKIAIRDLMKDLADCYFEALTNLLPAWRVQKALLRNELDEYAVYLRNAQKQESDE